MAAKTIVDVEVLVVMFVSFLVLSIINTPFLQEWPKKRYQKYTSFWMPIPSGIVILVDI